MLNLKVLQLIDRMECFDVAPEEFCINILSGSQAT